MRLKEKKGRKLKKKKGKRIASGREKGKEGLTDTGVLVHKGVEMGTPLVLVVGTDTPQ